MEGLTATRRAVAASALLALAAAATPAVASFEYAYDDGSGSTTISAAFDATHHWGNYYFAQPGADTIVSLEISFSSNLPVGLDLTLLVYDDPDNDGDPRNAVLIYQSQSETRRTLPQEFASYEIDPTGVSGGFFVAAAVTVPRGQAVGRADIDNPGTNSWLFFDGPLNTDLASTPFQLRMSEGPFNAAWMFRATAVPGPGGLVVLAPLVLGAGRRRRRVF